ncbi:MAG TPA: aromatic ring-hydroxylating dioxygenase subunit alpha [Candidatus Udaeobacter sp.]|nr:aromatic ring-hydroxylating dioxygenase subunit alpha [Candidatus Udaeobacter sp.]
MNKAAQVPPAFQKTTATFAADARSLPQRYFVSRDVFEQEQEKIFSGQWVLVGHQSQLKKSGDFFLATIAGESLIVVRDQKSEVRAFYNVCRHRGARLKEDACGHASAIQCPYHAWTYALDGRLIGAPHMDDVPGFDKADYSLHPVNLGVWGGFIFVNLADASTSRSNRDYMSLEEWFAPLNGKFSRWNLAALLSAKRIEYDVQANWKLIFQNYSECYHCLGVHPELSKISPHDSAENDLTEGPFLGGFMRIAKGRSLTMSGKACALGIADSSRGHDRVPARNRNPSQEIENDDDHEHEHDGKNRVFYYSIFPNMLLSLHPDYVMVHQLEPQSPERTLIVCNWFFHPEAFEREDFKPEDAIEFWDMVNKQDWHVCELSQQGIASRAYVPGPYSARESISAAWDREYLRHIR